MDFPKEKSNCPNFFPKITLKNFEFWRKKSLKASKIAFWNTTFYQETTIQKLLDFGKNIYNLIFTFKKVLLGQNSPKRPTPFFLQHFGA